MSKDAKKSTELAKGVVAAAVSVMLMVNPITTKLVFGLSGGWIIFPAVLDGLLLAIALAAVGHVATGRRGFLALWIGLLVILLPSLFATEALIMHLSDRRREKQIDVTIENVHEEHDALGWIPIANARGQHKFEGNFDVEYEFDVLARKRIVRKAGSMPTIHVFGDSFAFGHGVSNSDSALTLLSTRLGERANVQNYAVMGYGLEQMVLRFFLAEGEVKRGDIILFAPTSVDVRRGVLTKSYICWLLTTKVQPVTHSPVFRNGAWRSVDMRKECSYVFDHLLMRSTMPFGAMWRAWRATRDAPELRAAIENAGEVFRAAKDAVERRGAQFRLLIFTTPAECEAGHHTIEWGEIGVPYADLLESCPEDADQLEALRFPDDGHLSPMGNRWAATAFEAWLSASVDL